MDKTRLLSVLFALCVTFSYSFAQQKASILISGHSFSEGKPEIGTLHISNGGTATFRLTGDNAKLFRIQDNKLSIRPQYIKGEIKWYDLDIEARTPEGRILESFRLVHDQFSRNGVIAHRGAWKNTGAPQNSIAALQHAVRLACEGSEFDVHLTGDDELIVTHDRTINGLAIATTNADQLKSIKLSNGENLPGIDAYMAEGVKQNTTKLVFEIKSTTTKERALKLAKMAVEVVKAYKAQGWVDYISFDYDICLELMRHDPFARVAYLNGDKSPEELAADKLWGYDYHFNVLKKNEHWIEDAKRKGLTINTWTVNDPEMLKWFLSKDIDFITTDEPELLLKLIGN